MKARHYVKIAILLSMLIAGGCVNKGCNGDSDVQGTAGGTGRIRLKGSQTINQELGPQFAKGFKAKHGVEVEIEAKGTGSGFKCLEDESCEIAAASERAGDKEETAAQAKGYSLNSGETVIGYDAIVILVSKRNPLNELTKQQLKDIFTGKTTKWSELVPNASPDQIHIAIPAEVHGTHKYFRRDVLEDEPFVSYLKDFPDTQGIDEYISKDDKAIGFVTISQVSKTKMLRIKASEKFGFVTPDSSSITDKTYPLGRELYLYTRGKSAGVAKQFIEYVTSPEGQSLVGAARFVAFSQSPPPPVVGKTEVPKKLSDFYVVPFDSSKATLDAGETSNEGRQRIESFIVDHCSPYGGAAVEVIGHSDKRGTEQQKEKISRDRAIGAKKILEERCPGLRVAPLWASDSQQIDEGDSKEALAKNRRAEIRVRSR